MAIVENEQHCDFKKLRSLLIRTQMHDLLETTRLVHYEHYRSTHLMSQGFSDPDTEMNARKMFEIKMKLDEENLRKRFTEQVKTEEQRFRQWEQRLMSERDRLNKDLESHHRLVKALEDDINDMAKR
jgi:cell division control protein 12